MSIYIFFCNLCVIIIEWRIRSCGLKESRRKKTWIWGSNNTLKNRLHPTPILVIRREVARTDPTHLTTRNKTTMTFTNSKSMGKETSCHWRRLSFLGSNWCEALQKMSRHGALNRKWLWNSVMKVVSQMTYCKRNTIVSRITRARTRNSSSNWDRILEVWLYMRQVVWWQLRKKWVLVDKMNIKEEVPKSLSNNQIKQQCKKTRVNHFHNW